MDILIQRNPIAPDFGDAVFINGPLTSNGLTTERKDTVAQRLRIRLCTFREEWFLDTTYGVPYWQEILGRKVSRSKVDQIFQEQILLEQGVREITYFTSTLINRAYSATFRVRVDSGEETEAITINPNI